MATAAAPNVADRALVVGINNYTRFAGGQANDLSGPVADAKAVAAWLTAAGVDVTLITSEGRLGPGALSEDYDLAALRPRVNDVQEPFHDLVVEAIANGLNGGQTRLARRLYVYMAGHGFMPDHNQLSIVTANSIDPHFVQSVQATAWMDWFSDQFHFDELVLWMDCCAGRNYFQPSQRPLLPQQWARNGPPAKMFVAFAAKPSRDAYEKPLPPNNAVRGLFTARLLAGLNGEAVDAQGRITTQSLIGYLTGQGLVGQEPVASLDGAVHPEHHFPKQDQLVFAEVAAPTIGYRIHLPLPGGTQVVIRDGTLAQVAGETVANGIVTVTLGLGLYKAEAPGFSDYFEIAAGTGHDISFN